MRYLRYLTTWSSTEDLKMSSSSNCRKRRNEPEVIVFEEPTSSSRGRKRGREAARERERFLVRVLCVVWTQDPSCQKSLDPRLYCVVHAQCYLPLSVYLSIYVLSMIDWFQSGNVSEIFGSHGREVEGEAGSSRKGRGEKSDDVIDFKATLREVNSLGVCACVCMCVCLCLPSRLEEVLGLGTEDALLLISSFQLLPV